MAKRKSSNGSRGESVEAGNPRQSVPAGPQGADSQATTPTRPQAGNGAQDAAQEGQQADSHASTTDTHNEAPGKAGQHEPAGQQETGANSRQGTHSTDSQQKTAGQASEQAASKETGNVPNSTAAIVPAPGAAAAIACVRERLMLRDDWTYISRLAKEMRSECNRARMTAEAREQYVWTELDRLYPPEAQTEPIAGDRQKAQIALSASENPGKQAASSQVADSGRVQGLGELPADWPELPANASLAAEVGWVQANRLYVVEELASGGTRVRLDRAHEPAPSRAAIGWLETSIRSYAKFVEVAAKVSGSAQDEQAQVMQERMQLDEIRALLAEMLDAQAGN